MDTIYTSNEIILQHASAAWRDNSKALAKWAATLVNRGSWGFGCYSSSGASFTQKNEPLTLHKLTRHFDGTGLRIGLHAISPVDSMTRWGGIDIDAHTAARHDHREVALRIARKLMSVGITPVVEDSNGNGGWHIIVIFSVKIPAENIRRLLMWACDYSEDHEIFPKQDKIKEDGFGNFLRLPGKHHTRAHWSSFWCPVEERDYVGADAPGFLLACCTTNDPACIPLDVLEYDPPKTAKPVVVSLDGELIEGEGGTWLKRFKGDLKTLRFIDLLEDCGLDPDEIGDGKYQIECPWKDDHTTESKGTCVWWEPGTYPTWCCLHAHCKGRQHISHLLAALGEEKVDGFCTKQFVPGGAAAEQLAAAYAAHPELAPDHTPGDTPVTTPSSISPEDTDFFTKLRATPTPAATTSKDENTVTELQVAVEMVARHGKLLRYCENLRGWHCWDGKRWTDNTDRSAEVLVWEMVKAYLKEIGCKKFETLRTLKAIVGLMSMHPDVNVSSTEFDAQELLFNCQNGVVDLVTGDLLPHAPELMMTKISPAAYHPGKKSRLWDKVLTEYWSDPELMRYVQSVAGVTLTGEQVKLMLFLYGGGDNGKSTFVDAIRYVMGDYSRAIMVESLMRKRGNGTINNDIAATRGARMLVSSETEEGASMDEQLVKVLTGKDTVSARFLHKEFFEFKPQFTLWLQGNHKPTVTGTDDAIWGRLKLINFSRQFKEDEKDPDMDKKLRENADAILGWMVEGCVRYKTEGIVEPESVQLATAEYRAESDKIGEFIGEMLINSPGCSVPKSTVYTHYQAWCKRSGYKPFSMNRLARQLKTKGFEEGRADRKTVRVWDGWLINLDEASAALDAILTPQAD